MSAKGVDELPVELAQRYRSKRHLAALVEIGRVLRDAGMTWRSLARALAAAERDEAEAEREAERESWFEVPASQMLAVVERLERVQPWPPNSSAPMFMRTLRGLAAKHEVVELSPRQKEWVEMLLARAKQMVEREPPVEATATKPVEAYTGNVVQLRPRGRV